MFQNNNKGIVRRLAYSSIKASKKRNFFVILSIAFAACLMLVLALYILGRSRETNDFLRGRYQVAFIELGDTTIDAMKSNEEVEMLGKKFELAKTRIGDYTLDIKYEDKTALKLLSAPEIKGHLPEQKNEIVVEQSYLDHIGLADTLGQQIKMNLGDGSEKDYTICGILQGQENASRVYQVIPSAAYVASVVGDNPLYTALIRLRDSENLSTEILKAEIQSIAKEFDIPEEKIFYSSTYFNLTKEYSAMTIAMIIAAIIVIVIACSLVIYSLFYISVVGKTQEYGRLRVIGTTKKQIKKMVQKEGIVLGAIAIPLGLVFGCLIGYLLVPKGWHLPTAIISMILIALVVKVTISVAIRIPVKMAASVSPIEAVHITSYEGMLNVKKSKKLHRSITPVSLAWMNFARNKRKAVLTLLSLGFTGILLMTSSAYLNSIDAEKMARQAFPNGEFNITLSPNHTASDTMSTAYTRLQTQNPINEELESLLLAVDGVTGIEKFIGCESDLIFSNGNEDSFRVIGLTKQQLDKYQIHLLVGTADYDELVKNHGILISDTDKLLSKIFKYDAALGDTIEIITDEGATEEFQVMGIMEDMHTGIDMPFFFTPDTSIPLLKSSVSNFNTHFMVQADIGKLDSVEKQIFELAAQNQDLEISTIKDIANSLQHSLDIQKAPLYGLIAFIAIFGFINFINTLMTNILSRQQEFGILQSIGLSNRQLSKMLQMEGLFYVLGTMAATLTIGTACGFLLCQVFNQFGTFGKLTYHFPILQIVIYFVALILIQGTYSLVAIYFCKKRSLVERIHVLE